MGFFDFLQSPKAPQTKPQPSVAPAWQTPQAPRPTLPKPTIPPAPTSPVAPPAYKPAVAPAKPVQQPAPPKVDQPSVMQPKVMEAWRLIFRMSSQNAELLEKFEKELIKKANYTWHHLKGRIGPHTDGKRVRVEVKGFAGDIESFVEWCKQSHFGIHAFDVQRVKIGSVPYDGLFQKKVGQWSH